MKTQTHSSSFGTTPLNSALQRDALALERERGGLLILMHLLDATLAL